MIYNVEGYVAKPDMLKMLHHHLLGPGWPDDEQRVVKALTRGGYINQRGVITKLSSYFEDMLDRGCLSDDYAEFVYVAAEATSLVEAQRVAEDGRHWVYWPYVYDPNDEED